VLSGGVRGMAVRVMRIIFCLSLLGFVSSCRAPLPETPRLAVLVIFDQMRAAELDRYSAFFEGGFGGLEGRGGARYDARYHYANTETAPGHATISTGANPDVHGIVSNYWFDENGKRVYSIDDETAPVLGAKKPRGASAKALRAQTLGDTMKAESHGRARVVTLSMKDRSAILTGGRAAEMALWYDPDQCAFTTSKAYAAELPGWVRWTTTEFPQRSMKEGTWSPLPVPRGLEALVPFDASPNEAAEAAWKDTFPHDLKGIADERQRCLAYRQSPQAIADLFDIARVAVESRDLSFGDDIVPDLLVISVSTTDYVGHGYGPQSLEMLDILRRADLAMRGFVKLLDARFGRSGYVMGVSSDHGSTPVAEVGKALGLDVGRISVPRLKQRIEEAIDLTVTRLQPKAGRPAPAQASLAEQRLGKPDRSQLTPSDKIAPRAPSSAPVTSWLKGFAPPHIFLDLARLEPAVRAQALESARKAVATFEGIDQAYLVEQGRVVGDDPFVPFFQSLVFAERNGAIMARAKARWTYAFDQETVGTDHGSPYTHDTTVPFIIAGPGVHGGRYAQPIDVRDIAPTLAFLLKMPAPDHAQGHPVSAVGAEISK
jgi:Type I phosphodiesterase / nucleotide pyrophosphatase